MGALCTLVLASPLRSGPETEFVLTPPLSGAPVVVDGILDDGAWGGAAVAAEFLQYEPYRGVPSETRSEVLVTYDTVNLYIGYRLWDPEPVVASLTRRDADLFLDDAVILILDTYHDRRSGYLFLTNLLGTQADGRIADDGRTVDYTWDAPWQSAAQRTDFGWSAEIRIPFTSLNYTAGDSVRWGTNFGRVRRRNLELSFWAGPLDYKYRVSQAGSLTGLRLTAQEKRHQIIPFALSRLQEGEPPRAEAGADLRYTLSPTLNAYATVNPDFATIEADQEVVNLSRFELSLPEKRQFFLEGSELFQQRIRTFYSRRIPDILLGGKLQGKAGTWTLAGLVAQSERIDENDPAMYSVLRTQKDVGGSSTVAMMVADRARQGRHQGSAGMDATLFFTETLGLTAQLIRTYGVASTGSWAYFVRPAYDSPTMHYHVRYTHLGENVADNANAVGFISDDNRRELDAAFEKALWPQGGPLEVFGYESNYNIYWGQDGTLRSWQIDQEVAAEFRNRIFAGMSWTEEFKRFEKDFRNRRGSLVLGYNTREFQSVELGYVFGRNFDADLRLWNVEAGYKLTEQFSVEYELQYLTLRPDPENESTWIHVVKANQFFTKDLFLRLFFQVNTSIRRENVQLVFVYRYQPPFGTIQLAYQRGTAEFGQRSTQGNTLFVKVTHVF